LILDCRAGFEIVLRGFEILGYIVLGFLVLGSKILGFFILIPRKEDPLGFRILNPCFKDFFVLTKFTTFSHSVLFTLNFERLGDDFRNHSILRYCQSQGGRVYHFCLKMLCVNQVVLMLGSSIRRKLSLGVGTEEVLISFAVRVAAGNSLQSESLLWAQF